jgi:Flp pilus assembly protein TadD
MAFAQTFWGIGKPVPFVAARLLIALAVMNGLAYSFEEEFDFARATAWRLEGNNRKALEALERVLEKSPNHVDAMVRMGTVLEDLGRLTDAEKSYRRALEINPNHESAKRNIEQLEVGRSIRTPPRMPHPAKEALVNNGLRLLEGKDFAGGQRAFDLARALAPDDPRPLFYSALCRELLGDPGEAAGIYGKLITAFPNFGPAWVNLVISLLKSGDKEQAAKRASEARAKLPENNRIRGLIAVMDSERGRPEPQELLSSSQGDNEP